MSRMPRNDSVAEETHRPFTIADYGGPADRRSALRRTPQMTMGAVRLVAKADPRHLASTLVLQVLSAGGVAAQLLVARKLFSALGVFSQTGSSSSLVKPFAAFVAVLFALALITAFAAHQRALLSE